MRISAIKTFVIDCYRTNWVFVKVSTDEGLHGIGEGTLEYKESALCGAITDLEHADVFGRRSGQFRDVDENRIPGFVFESDRGAAASVVSAGQDQDGREEEG